MAEEQAAEKRLAIGKIYLKDFSFESPQAPEIFRQSEWSPKTDLNLRSSHTSVSDEHHEVVLTVTVEAKADDKSLFLIELQQAGLFEIVGYEGEELGAIIGSFCPNILFPYARSRSSGRQRLRYQGIRSKRLATNSSLLPPVHRTAYRLAHRPP